METGNKELLLSLPHLLDGLGWSWSRSSVSRILWCARAGLQSLSTGSWHRDTAHGRSTAWISLLLVIPWPLWDPLELLASCRTRSSFS